MTGYKATDAEMKCHGFQFKLDEWYEYDGEVAMCVSGFHFCIYPSGPLCFYSAEDSRVFKVEAEQVLEVPTEAGADFKLVAKRIRLIEEITPGKTGNDKSNTGDSNTGDSNTGDRNTGNSNTGDSNTGDRNTGNSNTGYSNTGDCNTGYWNTGNWNTGNRNAGFFCSKEPKMISFDVQTNLTFEEFLNKFPQAYKLGELLEGKELIKFEQFKMLPGITKKKLTALHKKRLEAKEKKS